jgi:hypothetical protein
VVMLVTGRFPILFSQRKDFGQIVFNDDCNNA